MANPPYIFWFIFGPFTNPPFGIGKAISFDLQVKRNPTHQKDVHPDATYRGTKLSPGSGPPATMWWLCPWCSDFCRSLVGRLENHISPWKINGWNLRIPALEKGKTSSKPSIFRFYVSSSGLFCSWRNSCCASSRYFVDFLCFCVISQNSPIVKETIETSFIGPTKYPPKKVSRLAIGWVLRIDRRQAGKFSKVPCFPHGPIWEWNPVKKALFRDDLFLVSSHAKVWNPKIGLIHASVVCPDFLGCISPQMTFVFWSDGRTYI